MRARIRRPKHATVVAYLALFVALGGTAYAVNTIGSADVIDNSLVSEDIKNETIRGGDIAPSTIGSSDVFDGSIASADVKNDTVTGDDIKDKSGVDTCPHPATARFGDICAGLGDVSSEMWFVSGDTCEDLKLRLPTLGEAGALAKNYDVPGVSATEAFWTDEIWVSEGVLVAATMSEDGAGSFASLPTGNADNTYTVCVTTPTN